ncbi:MAG: hypothetical protein AAF078_14850, partial [Planctomycetota bacterium]
MPNPNVEFNVFGGRVDRIGVYNQATMNISGGSAVIDAVFGSFVNLSGGSASLQVWPDASVTITGGHVNRLSASDGSDVTLVGGEFFVNGTPFAGDTVTFTDPNDNLTGILQDGTPIALFGQPLSGVTLSKIAIDPPSLEPILVDAANPQGPDSLRPGQTLALRDGGELPGGFIAESATMNVAGGRLAGGLTAVNSDVRITGHLEGLQIQSVGNSRVVLTDATVQPRLSASAGGTIEIGGASSVPNDFSIGQGGVGILTGGEMARVSVGIGGRFEVQGGVVERVFGGGETTLAGGRVGNNSGFRSSSALELVGGEFRLNGVGVAGFALDFRGEPGILTGTLADGTPLLLRTEDLPTGDRIVLTQAD